MIHYLLTFNKKRQYALFVGDMLTICISIVISYLIRDYINQEPHIMHMMQKRFNAWLILVLFLHWFTLYSMGQYSLIRLISPLRSSITVIISVWLAGLFISGVFFFSPKYIIGRQVLVMHLGVASMSLFLWRLLFSNLLLLKSKPKRLAVIGDGQIVSSFIEEIAQMNNSGFKVSNVCLPNENPSTTCFPAGGVKHYSSIFEILEDKNFDAVTFDSIGGHFSDDEIRLILQLKYEGKALYDLPSLYINLTGKVPLTYIDGRWLLNSNGLQGEINKPYVRTKRIFDVLLSVILRTP